MAHTFVHDTVIGGKFSDSTHVVKVDSLEQALNYYESNLRQPLAHRVQQNLVESLKYLRNTGHNIPNVDGDQGPDDVPTTERMRKFRGLVNGEKEVALKMKWPNLWKVHLYTNKNFGGRQFSLDCKWTDFAMDSNLLDNNFNDKASSIDMGKFVVCTVAARDVNFGGDWWWFIKDDKNLSNNGCNDRISSVAATGFSISTMIAAIKAIAG